MTNTRPRINNPLNFSKSNSLITTKVPHYATKDGTAVSIIPGLSRPLANGIDTNSTENQISNGPIVCYYLLHLGMHIADYSV